MYDTRTQKADGIGEALAMGLHRTWRTVKVIYQTLYATIFRQISMKTISGPLQIANASYKIAGYDCGSSSCSSASSTSTWPS